MRRNHGLLLSLSTCLTIIFIVLNTRSSTELLGSAIIAEKHISALKEQEASRVDDRWIRSQARRYVTPSLAELGNLPYKHKHVLMLTRIPGAGAELMVLILQRLQGYNAFKHIRLPPGDHGLLSTSQQELLVEEITGIIRQEAIPLTFDGDVRFLNFSEFGRQGPTFISLVRDPLDPRIWQRNKKGEEETLYHGIISYFCGQDPRCTEQNNTWATERAKANVIRWYPVVGILDYMEESLNALAAEFPYFFKGATRVYDNFRQPLHMLRPYSMASGRVACGENAVGMSPAPLSAASQCFTQRDIALNDTGILPFVSPLHIRPYRGRFLTLLM